ncbi:MAG: hypothetical protein MZV63_29645 [Marinilabiliales bacterium]|nr:hypothetical protein [Marinilabiliales bacterium]
MSSTAAACAIPLSVTELNDLTGLDPEVAEFFGNDDEAVAFVGDCTNIIRNSLPMMRRKGILEISMLPSDAWADATAQSGAPQGLHQCFQQCPE